MFINYTYIVLLVILTATIFITYDVHPHDTENSLVEELSRQDPFGRPREDGSQETGSQEHGFQGNHNVGLRKKENTQ